MIDFIKKKFNIIIILLSALILVVCIFVVDNPKNLFNALTTAQPVWLLCALLCIVCSWICEGAQLKFISNGIKCKVSFLNCIRNTMIGQLFNCITPFATGGQPMQIYHMTKNKVTLGEASCILLARFAVYQFALTAWSFIAVISKFYFFSNKISGFGYISFIGFTINTAVLILLICVGFFPVFTKKAANALLKLLGKFKFINKQKLEEKIKNELEVFYRDFSVLKKDLKILIMPVIMAFLQLGFFFTIPFFVCISLGVTGLDWYTLSCAAAYVLMISSFIPLPGGSGGAEGGFYVFFKVFISQNGLLAVALLLWRFFTFYLPIIVGTFFSRNIRKEN